MVIIQGLIQVGSLSRMARLVKKTDHYLLILVPAKLKKSFMKQNEVKKTAEVKYVEAKENVKKVLTDIRETGGKFDYNEVEGNVADLVGFLTETDNAFSFLTKELFSYDDYLYNHSVNVCEIGTAISNLFKWMPIEV